MMHILFAVVLSASVGSWSAGQHQLFREKYVTAARDANSHQLRIDTLSASACDSVVCANGGTCNAVSLTATNCSCATGWYGTLCDVDPCSTNPCLNNGTCTATGETTYNCSCTAGWYGDTCNTDPCASAPCLNGGTCAPTGEHTVNCTCASGYVGHFCGFAETVCELNPCQNGGNFSCSCPTGWLDEVCDNADDCLGVTACQNGGTCVDGNDTYTCSCVTGYLDENCTTYPFEYSQGPLSFTAFAGTIAYAEAGIALDADALTLAVGFMDSGSGGDGAILVYTREPGNETWVQQGPQLEGSGASGLDAMGRSVDISDDGNIIIGGSRDHNVGAGAVWVFERNASGVWSEQAGPLTGTGAVGAASQGHASSLSQDGTVFVTGGYSDNSNLGAVWVFQYNGTDWNQVGSKLTHSNATAGALVGRSVVISADGKTVVAGGPVDGSSKGAAFVWTETGGVWSETGAKLVPTGVSSFAGCGNSVDMTADGNTLFVGCSEDDNGNDNIGSIVVYDRDGANWVQRAAKIVATSFTTNFVAGTGFRTSVTGDGTTVVSGHYAFDPSTRGEVMVYRLIDGQYVQQGSQFKHPTIPGTNQARFGRDVDIAKNGTHFAALADSDSGLADSGGIVYRQLP